MSEDGSDSVGYRKPPRHTRFQPGQSGNPKGRKKGTRGLKTDLHAELVSRMTIQINGRSVTATKQQLMIKTLTARAAAGDIRAIKSLVDLVMQVFGSEDRGTGPARLSPRDQKLLEGLLADRGAGSEPSLSPPEAEAEDTSDGGA